jgi:hypothetical protein
MNSDPLLSCLGAVLGPLLSWMLAADWLTIINSLTISNWLFAEQSRSLLPTTSQHGPSWHRAPLGPMAIYLFNVKTFLSFVVPPSIKREGLDFFYNWCSLTTPFPTRRHYLLSKSTPLNRYIRTEYRTPLTGFSSVSTIWLLTKRLTVNSIRCLGTGRQYSCF